MTTTQQALDGLLIDCEARGLAAKTLSYYQQQVGKLVTWLTQQGVTELETVSTDDLRRYLVHLKKSGIAPASQHAGARALRAWLNWCERMDMLPGKNPVAKLTMPKRPKTMRPAVSLADVKKLLEACDGARDPLRERAIVLVLVDTGIRASELCALRVGDLVGARLFVRHGKGDKARPVFVGNVTQQALEAYLSQRNAGKNEPMFLSHETGGALQYIGLHEILQRLGKRSGVVVACHGLRRTFAVESLRAGCDLVRLARMMGHSDLTMLERHYLPLLEDDLAAAHRASSPADRL